MACYQDAAGSLAPSSMRYMRMSVEARVHTTSTQRPVVAPHLIMGMPAVQVPPFDGVYTCKGKCAELVYDKVFKTAAGNAITACMGTVPGYWFTIAFVDIIGRVNIQYIGVCLLTSAQCRHRW